MERLQRGIAAVPSWRLATLLGVVGALAAGASVLAGGALAGGATVRRTATHDLAAATRVLRVGTYRGIPGQYDSLQAAVDAARPGDWILIAPGDWKTSSFRAPKHDSASPAAVLITTPRLHLRGMNRNAVVIDGTRPGSARCSTRKGDQNFGPKRHHAKGGLGLNGIMVYKAGQVSVENLTACNFLGSASHNGLTGNEIWWNGGADSGKIGGHGFYGSYLTATSTFYGGQATAAAYGIFSVNWSGGSWNWTYTSNFNDSGIYIGACQQVCNQTVNHAWSEYNPLGYSGSNSGGRLVVENSQFDHNQDGFDTNSQNGDNPPPQNGACPNGGISPITHTHSCWVFMHNYVHDNNNPNVPSAGFPAAAPVGTGVSVSGARNDTIMGNLFVHNGAWGTIFVPFPDSGPPCTGGTQTGAFCLYDEYGDALINNRYKGNGFFGNQTNGDFGAFNLEPAEKTDCYRANKKVGGGAPTTSPPKLQQMYPKCRGTALAPNPNVLFAAEVGCDSQISFSPGGKIPCAPGMHYPRRKRVIMHPLPKGLKSMPNPCAGVPKNPWCP